MPPLFIERRGASFTRPPSFGHSGRASVCRDPQRVHLKYPAVARTLCLQLPLQLFKKAPVGAVRDNLLRARFDHAGFLHPE